MNAALNEQAAAAGAAGEAQQGLADKASAAAEKMSQVGDKLTDFGRKTRKVSAAAAAGATMMVKEYMDLEDKMYTVATLPGVTASELPEYTDAILKASDATGIAATELAEAQYTAISSGVAAKDSVEFVRLAAMAAKAGLTDTQTVVDGATSILNAWGDTAGGVEHVLDVMTVAQNEGKVTIGQIAQNIGTLTGIAPQVNMSMEEAAAAIAALTKNGVDASTATTGLRAILTSVIKPTSEASKLAKKLGIDFSAAGFQAKGLTGFLADVMEKTNGDTEALGQLFGNVRGLSQVMLLGAGAAEDYAHTLEAMGNSAGVMTEAYETRMGSRAQQLQKSLNALKNSGMGIAENLTPAVDALSGMANQAAAFVGSMTQGQQQAAATGLVAVAALSPVATALGNILKTSKLVMAAMSGPGGWIALGAAGIAALVHGLSVLDGSNKTTKQVVTENLANLEIQVTPDSGPNITQAINSAVDAAKKDYSVQVKVKAFVEDAESMMDTITEDGKVTQAEYNAATKFVREKVKPDIDAAKKEADQLWKEAYQAALGQGASKEDAKAQADSVSAPLKEAAAELQDLMNQYQGLLKTVQKQGVDASSEELDEMQGILARMQDVKKQIADLLGESNPEGRNSSGAAKNGAADIETQAAAAAYETELMRQETEAMNAAQAEAMQANNEALAAAAQGSAEYDAIMEERNALLASGKQAARDLQREYTENLNDMYESVTGANEDLAGKFNDTILAADIIAGEDSLRGWWDTWWENIPYDWGEEEMVGAMKNLEGTRFGEAFQMLFGKSLTEGFQDSDNPHMFITTLMDNMMTAASEYLKTSTDEMDESPLTSILQAWAEAGVDFENLDTESMSTDLRDGIKMLLMGSDGADVIGNDFWNELSPALGNEQNYMPIINAAEGVGDQINDALTVSGGGGGNPYAELQEDISNPEYVDPVVEGAEEAAGRISGALHVSAGDAGVGGVMASATGSIRTQGAATLAAAAEWRASLDALLSGFSVPQWPGGGAPGGGGSSGGSTTITGNTNVNIHSANFGNRASADAVLSQIAGAQKKALMARGGRG